jgi:hypothetical protein
MSDPVKIGKHIIIDGYGNIPSEYAFSIMGIAMIGIIIWGMVMVGTIGNPFMQNAGLICMGSFLLLIGLFLMYMGFTGRV